ncbi:MAG: 16S rRNA (guanine(527)-N(7))-methyltransferase RsmG [Pirellulales bacterium]|nr:16S rRNA (guanine(527)-N(7))-methyltransferase RsmG [Pirellulales bacterium]
MTTEPNSLAETLSAHQLDLPQEQIQTLDRYRALLWKWNERLNLTRHTTLEKFVTRDVLDSLELAKLIDKGQRVLDVGTGGGVPGMILCICRPDLSVTVCDSVQKKAKVVQTMVEELQLPVQVLARRVEDVLQKQTFHSLVARGVAPLPKMLRWLEPHWSAFEELLLIKGQRWIEERGEARHLGLLKPLELRKVASYLTFGTDRESVILSLRAECD